MAFTEVVFRAAKKLKENPILVLPSLLLLTFTALSKFLMFKYGKFNELAQIVDSIIKAKVSTSFVAEKFQFEMLVSFFQNYWAQLLTSGIAFFLATFVVGVGMMAFEFVMIKNMINKKEIRLWKDRQEKKRYFWGIVFIRIFTYVLSFIILAITGGLALGIYLMTKQITPTTITFGAITAALASLFLLLVRLSLLFVYPGLLFGKTTNPVKAIKNTFLFFKTNPSYTFYAWFTVLVISTAIGIAEFIGGYAENLLVNVIEKFVSNIGLKATLSGIAVSSYNFIVFLAKLFFGVWTNIFLFYCYKEKG